MTIAIYKIINKIDGKIYIGSSINIERRLIEHKIRLNKNKHENPYLQNACNLHGIDNFIFEIIEETDQNILLEREQYWMDITKCYERDVGYNICNRADRPPTWSGWHHTEETKEKLRKINSGKNNPNYGKHASQETRRKKSDAIKGEKNHFYGKKHKKETLEKIGKSSKGRNVGEKMALAKLTWRDVQTIRNLYKEKEINGVSYRILSIKYKVTATTIYSIIKNKTWRE